MKRWLKLGGLIIVLFIVSATIYDVIYSKINKSSSESRITAVGSTALQPLAEDAAAQFQKAHPQFDITVQGGGSGTGLSQVQAGTVNIGDSDIFAEQKTGINYKKLRDYKVAVVGIAPVVSRDLKVNNLTMAQLAAIFTGKITNWQQVGGPNKKITIINRAAGSGTRAAFESAVLMPGTQSVTAQEQDSNGTVQKLVAATPGAISYLALPYINNSLQALEIDGVSASAKTIATNDWKIWSYEHMYTQMKATKATKKFLAYIMSTDAQNNVVKKSGYISIQDMKVTKDAKGRVTRKG